MGQLFNLRLFLNEKKPLQISIKKIIIGIPVLTSYLQLIAHSDYSALSLENSLHYSRCTWCLEGAQSHLSPSKLVCKNFYTSKTLEYSDTGQECFILFKLQVQLSLKVWIALQVCLINSTARCSFMYSSRFDSTLMNSAHIALKVAVVENFFY